MSDDEVKVAETEDAKLALQAQVEIRMNSKGESGWWHPLSVWDLGCDPLLVKLLKERATEWPADVPPATRERNLACCTPALFEELYGVLTEAEEAECLIPFCLVSSLDCLTEAAEDFEEEEGGICDVRILWWLEEAEDEADAGPSRS